MAQLLVRDLTPETVERLKTHAEQHGRSLQGEVKAILESAAASPTMSETRKTAEEWHRRLAGRMTSDSADLVREDRER
jgi:plasmid stability protein